MKEISVYSEGESSFVRDVAFELELRDDAEEELTRGFILRVREGCAGRKVGRQRKQHVQRPRGRREPSVVKALKGG